jgi:hypothetical protein
MPIPKGAAISRIDGMKEIDDHKISAQKVVLECPRWENRQLCVGFELSTFFCIICGSLCLGLMISTFEVINQAPLEFDSSTGWYYKGYSFVFGVVGWEWKSFNFLRWHEHICWYRYYWSILSARSPCWPGREHYYRLMLP